MQGNARKENHGKTKHFARHQDQHKVTAHKKKTTHIDPPALTALLRKLYNCAINLRFSKDSQG